MAELDETAILKLGVDYLENENARLMLRIQNMMWWQLNREFINEDVKECSKEPKGE